MLRTFFANFKNKMFYTYLITLINFNSFVRYLYNTWISAFVLVEEKGFVHVSIWSYIFWALIISIQILMCGGFVFICLVKHAKTFITNNNEDTSEGEKLSLELSAIDSGSILQHQIFTFNYVSTIESNCKKGSEIWIITGDLDEDVSNTQLVNIIQKNLEKGVTYKYFISKVAGDITNSARLGLEKLKNNHSKYDGKRLQYSEISSELIAPDIDIIIYNATSLSERRAFVCVEIGDDENTYAYQELEQRIVQQIINNVSEKPFYTKRRLATKSFKAASLYIICYDIISALLLAILGFTKILTIPDLLLSILPSIVISILTYMFINQLNSYSVQYETKIERLQIEKNALDKTVSDPNLITPLRVLKEQKQREMLSTLQLGKADEVLEVKSDCKTIWISSNLSHDFASDNFINWLENALTTYSNIKCEVLYAETLTAKGRLSILEDLNTKFSGRVTGYSLTELKNHGIWCETYGIVFFESKKNNHSMYVSLGNADDPLYKKVIATNTQLATVLGILKKLRETNERL